MNAKNANWEMFTSGGTQPFNQSFPLQTEFPSTHPHYSLPVRFLQCVPGTTSREVPGLPPSLVVFYSMFHTRSQRYLGHSSTYKQSKLTWTGTATRIISTTVPLPAPSLVQHKRECKQRLDSEATVISISLPLAQKPDHCLPRHKGDDFHWHLEAVRDSFVLCNYNYH